MQTTARKRLLLGAAVVGGLLFVAFQDVPVLGALAKVLLAVGLLVGLLWGLWKGWRLFLWRVGRKLALSYFLIGVLPIPMVVLEALLTAYIVSGAFLGHLHRTTVERLHHELDLAAENRLAELAGGRLAEIGAPGPLVFGYYRAGQRVAGDAGTPAGWPLWLAELEAARGGGAARRPPPYVALEDGTITLASLAGDAGLGVLALWAEPVEDRLTEITHVWVQLVDPAQAADRSLVRLRVGGREFPLRPVVLKRGERSDFFGRPDGGELPWLDRPLLWWGELAGSLRSLADGQVLTQELAVTLNGTARTVGQTLFSPAAEVDTAAWATLFGVAGLLSTLYGVAALMALFMIVSLSRAVNRLSSATESVRRGDFSVRIPVRRKDQVGELQRSFNEMAANLESLVAAAAANEIVENELAIARDLQRRLLPRDLPQLEGVEFATLFEPSAAIGGDYYDILRLGDGRLAVVIADVSGHGLPTGLRMAMLKAALVILVEEDKAPRQILERLSDMIRSSDERRYFVTSTIGLLDLARGSLALTNAGHPPTYLLRGGEVDEILLPGAPLGALGSHYGEREVGLADGDVVVWLSDGLIEAVNGRGEVFGYDRVRRALQGPGTSASEVRDRLVADVRHHCAGAPVEDDMTLVAMRYRRAAAPSSSRPRET